MNDLLKVAKSLQDNNIKEADAISYYTETINFILSADIEEEKKERVVADLSEIIADELDHQQKLEELYTFLTTIAKKGEK